LIGIKKAQQTRPDDGLSATRRNDARECRNFSVPWRGCAGRIIWPDGLPLNGNAGRGSGPRKKEEDEYRNECAREWEPLKRQFKRSDMADSYAKPDFASQAMATQDAESLLRGVKLAPSGTVGSVALDQAQSN
jgi:hypothetical protein